MGLRVLVQDERLTTKSATRALLEGNVRRDKRRDVVDKLAACYILQSFLDSGGWPEDRDNNLPSIRGVWKMSENQDMNMEPDNIVELIDEDGKEVRFEHLMTLEHKGKTYICLMPLEPMEDVEDDELVILRIETDENGNDAYVSLDDEEEVDDVFEAYLEIAEADDEEDGEDDE
jgi:putative Holliday junction resolvase